MRQTATQNNDLELALHLAGGASVADAAKKAGIHRTTVYRRLEDPAFRQQVAAIRAAWLDGAVGQLSDAAAKAVEMLVELLESPSHSIRLGAARAILSIGPELREHIEWDARIVALEQGGNKHHTEQQGVVEDGK